MSSPAQLAVRSQQKQTPRSICGTKAVDKICFSLPPLNYYWGGRGTGLVYVTITQRSGVLQRVIWNSPPTETQCYTALSLSLGPADPLGLNAIIALQFSCLCLQLPVRTNSCIVHVRTVSFFHLLHLPYQKSLFYQADTQINHITIHNSAHLYTYNAAWNRIKSI